MLALRQIRLNDYYVVECGETIGRIRYSSERTPGAWIWNVHGLWNVRVHISEGLPAGTSPDLPTAKSDLRAAWESFKSKHKPEQFEAAFRAFPIRDDNRR
jgi:hypothetical protein